MTHLFGNPCDDRRDPRAGGRRTGIPVIEDCAQAYLARSDGRLVGHLGAIGCFSLQQGKHITTGEGGLVVTDDPRSPGGCRCSSTRRGPTARPNPDHEFLALNYRMTELQGAVAIAQLDKLEAGVAQRIAMADLLTRDARRGAGHRRRRSCATTTSRPTGGTRCSSTRDVIPGGPPALAAELRLGGIASAPRYIQKPAFACKVFAEQRTFGDSRWPFTLARPEAVDYAPSGSPARYAYLDRVLVLPWNERYEAQHVELLGDAIRAAVAQLSGAAMSGRPSDLKIGLVGAGGIAQTYVRVFEDVTGARDHRGRRRPAPGRGRAGRGRCAAPRTRRTARCSRTPTSTRSLVCTPPATHPEIVLQAHRARPRTCCARSRSPSTSRARQAMVAAAETRRRGVHDGGEVPLRRRRRSGPARSWRRASSAS